VKNISLNVQLLYSNVLPFDLSRLDITYLFVGIENYEFVQELKSKQRILKMLGFLNILMQPAIHTLLSKH